jgi:hypothetical protein
MRLRRYWFRFDNAAPNQAASLSPLGYGVTAWTQEDALALLGAALFGGGSPAVIAEIITDVDVSALDSGHILPNIEPPHWRGIWFPRGFALPWGCCIQLRYYPGETLVG